MDQKSDVKPQPIRQNGPFTHTNLRLRLALQKFCGVAADQEAVDSGQVASEAEVFDCLW